MRRETMEAIKEFVTSHLELVIGTLAVIVFVIQAVNAHKKAKRIDNEGIETGAVVSRIDETYDPDLNESSYTIYVRYTDDKGESVESPMALDPSEKYTVGQEVRIKYVPGIRNMVRPV